MTYDYLRSSFQNRALHCYIVMTIWILLLVAGIYKFLDLKQVSPEPITTTETFLNLAFDAKTKRIFQICNFPNDISPGNEGIIQSNKWSLKGIIVLIRHGDRGPLQHVRNISNINCAGISSDLLNSYKTYLQNVTSNGKTSWVTNGPFHGFPLLPVHSTQCQIGQLTMQGINQMLTLGNIIRESYMDTWPKLKNLTRNDILVYSTRYRRTFQSALAFLYGFIKQDVSKIMLYESQSINFCFKDCGCPVTDRLARTVKKIITRQLKAHPAISILTETTGKALLSTSAEQGILGGDPQAVRDVLLTYICHHSGLPCESSNNCIRRQNVAGIFAYTDWVNHQKWENIHWRRLCLLRSYGLIRHIVQQMLHMVSGNGPYFVLYSGHDHTIEQLVSVLGVPSDSLLTRYSARVVFEVYQDNRDLLNREATGVYFRVLSNGKDITRQIKFCKNTLPLENKVVLCRIEDIVRFLHDDYFSSLNVTNYKDAC